MSDLLSSTAAWHSCTGAILIGGRSSRMGAPKHQIRLRDGRLMIEHVADALRYVCSNIVIVDTHRTEPASDFLSTFHRVIDRRPQHGPLGGIEALLASGIDQQYLVCPCDVPRISPIVLRMIAQQRDSSTQPALATIVQFADRTEPESLPARISAEALPTVRTLLDSGQRSIWRLMQILPAETVLLPSEWAEHFVNINAPDDLDAL